VTANLWHACSRHTVDELLARSAPAARAAFDRLVALFERCGPIVVIAQKTRIVFMVRVRFAGCVVRRQHLLASLALPRRVEHPRWHSIEEVAPGWFVHRLEVRDGTELDDPELAALACESYRQMGEQRRLAGRHGRGRGDNRHSEHGRPASPGMDAAEKTGSAP
jgi:hypothetical protein